MIFHNTRTITIGGFSEMVTYKDYRKVLRFNIWLPEFILVKKYNSLLYEWNKLSNGDKVNKEFNRNKHKLKSLVQINIQYKIMLQLLDMAAKYSIKEAKEGLISIYSSIYKKEPKTAADYEKIAKDIDLKIRRYKQKYGQEQTEEGIEFEDLLTNIEVVLAPVTIREKKLYTLPKYIEMAAKKIKQNG